MADDQNEVPTCGVRFERHNTEYRCSLPSGHQPRDQHADEEHDVRWTSPSGQNATVGVPTPMRLVASPGEPTAEDQGTDLGAASADGPKVVEADPEAVLARPDPPLSLCTRCGAIVAKKDAMPIRGQEGQHGHLILASGAGSMCGPLARRFAYWIAGAWKIPAQPGIEGKQGSFSGEWVLGAPVRHGWQLEGVAQLVKRGMKMKDNKLGGAAILGAQVNVAVTFFSEIRAEW
jgi:hypothetical protein